MSRYVPQGGAADDVLKKGSANEYDFDWGPGMVGNRHIYQAAAPSQRIYVPSDAHLYTEAAAVNGAYKIVIPGGWSSHMLRIEIRGKDWVTDNHGWTLIVGGYPSGTSWSRTSAVLVGKMQNTNRVRFAHDGSDICIIIGNVGDLSRDYPSLHVASVEATFVESVDYRTGWSVSMITAETGLTFSGGDHQNLGYLPLAGGQMAGDIDVNNNVLDNIGSLRMAVQQVNSAMATDDLLPFFDSSSSVDQLFFADRDEILGWLKMPRVVAKATEGNIIVDSASQTVVFRYSVPANQLGTEGMLRMRLIASVRNAGNNVTLRVKFGGVTLWEDTTALWAAAVNGVCDIEVFIGNVNSTASQRGGGRVLISDDTAAAIGSGDLGALGYRSTAFTFAASTADTTAAQDLDITADFNGTSNLWFNQQGVCEFLPF